MKHFSRRELATTSFWQYDPSLAFKFINGSNLFNLNKDFNFPTEFSINLRNKLMK